MLLVVLFLFISVQFPVNFVFSSIFDFAINSFSIIFEALLEGRKLLAHRYFK